MTRATHVSREPNAPSQPHVQQQSLEQSLEQTPDARPRGIHEATATQVEAWLRAGQAVLVDVREPDEHARERIDGARLVPLSRFDPGLATSWAMRGQRLVLHCRGGKRSLEAARMAVAGAPWGVEVVNLTGGIEAWKRQGLAVVENKQISRLSVMRQVQMIIGVGVLSGAMLAWFVHPGFAGLSAFFGAGLIFAGATGICGLATLVGKLPWNRSTAVSASCGSGVPDAGAFGSGKVGTGPSR